MLELLHEIEQHVRPDDVLPDSTNPTVSSKTNTPSTRIEIDHPKHDYLAPHGGRRGMREVLVRAFGYTVAARYLDNSEEMVRERYSHIEAGELGDVATKVLNEIEPASRE